MSERNLIVVSDLSKEVCVERAPRYVVPIYQRVFAWGASEIERFLTDLYDHFVNKQLEEDYFLGIVTVVKSRTSPEEMILVDGQQRLTCIMLMGALLGLNLNQRRLKYEARPRDDEALQKVYSYFLVSNSAKPVPDSGNDAMDAFFSCAYELDARKDKMIQKLKDKREKIASHVKLFVSILPEEPYRENIKEQNRYFEKMNSGGKQLEPHEILKVRICSACSNPDASFKKWNLVTDFSRRYEDFSVQDRQELRNSETLNSLIFRKNYLGEEPTEGGEEYQPSRSGLLDLPMFLLHVLAICNDGILKDEWRSDKILEAFPPKEKITREWAEVFISEMESYRKFLDDKIIHLSYDAKNNIYDYKFEDDESDENSRIDNVASKFKLKLRQFQAMLFVASLGRQGKQEWLLAAYKSRNFIDGDYSERLTQLQKIDFSSSTEEQRSIDYIDKLCYADQSRWLFWRLDYLLWERVVDGLSTFTAGEDICGFWGGDLSPKDRKTIQCYQFHVGRSIEHLHPQTDDCDSAWNEGTPSRKDMFYNLCLLTSSWNSTLSNDSIAVKLAKIKDLTESGRAGLQSIKMLFMYKECNGVDSRWTPDIAIIHLKRMKQVLLRSYLYPNES